MASSDRPQDDFAGIEAALDHLLRLNASRKVHARRAAAVGVVISQPGLLLLRRLDEHGELSMGELARLTAMDPAAARRAWTLRLAFRRSSWSRTTSMPAKSSR